MIKQDLDAVHYRNHSSFQYESAMDLIRSHVFKEADRLLDVGCGDGRVTAELSKRLSKGKVVGLDLSPAMISLASSSFQIDEYPNIEFHECNAEEIPYTNQFDVVLSTNCLHWVQNKRKAFKGMMEALVPGGNLLVLMGTKDDGVGGQMEALSGEEKWKPYVSRATIPTIWQVSDVKEVLEELGAEIQTCEVREKVTEFDRKEDIATFIGMWIDYYLPLPNGLREEYLQIVVDKMAERSLNREGEKIAIPFKGVVVKATKRR